VTHAVAEYREFVLAITFAAWGLPRLSRCPGLGFARNRIGRERKSQKR
jgi:hypothetical protein